MTCSHGLRASLLPAGSWSVLIVLNTTEHTLGGDVVLGQEVLAAEDLLTGATHPVRGAVVNVALAGFGSLALRVRVAAGSAA